MHTEEEVLWCQRSSTSLVYEQEMHDKERALSHQSNRMMEGLTADVTSSAAGECIERIILSRLAGEISMRVKRSINL